MRIASLMLLSLLFFQAFGQDNLALVAGANYSVVRFDNDLEQQAIEPYLRFRPGSNVSFSWEHYFAKTLSLSAGILYIRKGFAYEYTYSVGYKRYDYIILSAAGQMDVFSTGNTDLSVFVAPYAGYWVYGYRFELDYKNGVILGSRIDFKDSTYEYNRWDAGIDLGLKAKLWQTESWALVVRGYYQWGRVSNDRYNVSGTKNRSFVIDAGLLFQIR